MTDREQIKRELAEELGWAIAEDGVVLWTTGGTTVPCEVRDALLSREIALRELRESKSTVVDHKWFDWKCHQEGCQSLVWQARAEAAKTALREARKKEESWKRKYEACLQAYNKTWPELEQVRGERDDWKRKFEELTPEDIRGMAWDTNALLTKELEQVREERNQALLLERRRREELTRINGFLEVERSNHETSIHEWRKDEKELTEVRKLLRRSKEAWATRSVNFERNVIEIEFAPAEALDAVLSPSPAPHAGDK